jgi:squalene-hopene/tetraprenyl-beta-curcumene cyclase
MSVEYAAQAAPKREALPRAEAALLQRQRPDGHWLFELEADATIPAEYVLLRHFRGEPVDAALEARIGAYLRRLQCDHGGWALYHGGALDISASVKAYFALKTIGDDPAQPHMQRAREAILAHGGAAQSNVFTRILLALFGILRWRAVPEMPVEIVLLPRWFPFHLSKVSYWARTVIVPLLVLQALRPRAKSPGAVRIDELFLEPPESVGPRSRAPHQKRSWFAAFRAIDVALRGFVRVAPAGLRRRAIARAAAFVTERLNGDDGLGAIFPAMANATLMFDTLGEPAKAAVARGSLDKLLVVGERETYCQPCVSPVWDTALACHALLETGTSAAQAAALRGLDWLLPRQVLDLRGDWTARRPDVRPGGWAFQYANPHYPDLDDTAVVVMAMDRARRSGAGNRFDRAIARGAEWIVGLQSSNGGWAAFDVDNTYDYLNNIPFADHGALIDPPTEDVTARCVSMLAQLGHSLQDETLSRGVSYLLRAQRADGSWYGRWGVNYIYGTWSSLCALNLCRTAETEAAMRRACGWLTAIQNPDGGWGESGDSYRLDYDGYRQAPSSASQTAWALLGLMAAGGAAQPAVGRGVDFLLRTQGGDGFWDEPYYTGGGFPRVFYLRYHGYSKYFPLWALARYRNLSGGGAGMMYGM